MKILEDNKNSELTLELGDLMRNLLMSFITDKEIKNLSDIFKITTACHVSLICHAVNTLISDDLTEQLDVLNQLTDIMKHVVEKSYKKINDNEMH